MDNGQTYSDTGNSKSNLQDFSVSEISAALKKTVEDRFGYVRVRGEITGYRGPHSSGHCYFALKDDRARLEAVIWKGNFNRLKHRPEEGLEVVASGKLTTYPGSSKYQIVIESIEPAGAGALMALLEERKKKLEAEGLFAPERKQLLPFLPKRIGVVTSPTGSVIRDILHRIADRFPLHVMVWPVRVQGDTTGQEVSNGIVGFNAMSPDVRPDVIIVARGGGSIEDLWGFNDEAVVRAAAASGIPLISAVGHETDWTLVDYAADVRAPTPTGAAEIAVPVLSELEATIASYRARLHSALTRRVDQSRSNLRAAERGLSTPDNLLAMPRRRFDEATGRLARGLGFAIQAKQSSFERVAPRLSKRGLFLALERFTDRLQVFQRQIRTAHRNNVNYAAQRAENLDRRYLTAFVSLRENASMRLQQADRLLQSYSFAGVLERGFAIIRDGDNQPIASASALRPGQPFEVEMRDGNIQAVVAGSSGKPKTKKTGGKGTADPKEQGDLF